MKRLIVVSTIAVSILTTYARPGCPAPHHPGPGPRAPYHPHHPHHPYHNNWWIGPTILGSAILGSAVINAATQPKTVIVQQTPTVVTQPVVVQQPVVTQPVVVQQPVVVKQPVQVWIDGHYVDRVQPNGSIIRVWQPGHYEWR